LSSANCLHKIELIFFFMSNRSLSEKEYPHCFSSFYVFDIYYRWHLRRTSYTTDFPRARIYDPYKSTAVKKSLHLCGVTWHELCIIRVRHCLQGCWKRYTVYSLSLCETVTTAESQAQGLRIALEDVSNGNIMYALHNGDMSLLQHLWIIITGRCVRQRPLQTGRRRI
jgi:hypothetical protein